MPLTRRLAERARRRIPTGELNRWLRESVARHRAELIDPVAEYDHSQADCSITGGYVYRGGMSEWNGIYLYGDYCSGTVRGLLRSPAPDVSGGWVSGPLFETGARITTFGQDQSGEIYLADRQGDVFRLQAASQ